MDRELVYKFPEDIKALYLKYFPDEKDTITYGNLKEKIEEAIQEGGGTGTIPFSNIFECIESKIEVTKGT